MRIVFLLLISCAIWGRHFSVNVPKREEPLELKTSVIIPCTANHFQHIGLLLERYAEQTQVPDEVVISLSQVELLAEEVVAAVEMGAWPFRVQILRHIGKRSAGMNRNLACKIASGDLFLCQDADDLPHPQRVEIVKFFFERYEIDHLIHAWVEEGEGWPEIPAKEALKLRYFKHYDDIGIVYQAGAAVRFHNGNVCLLAFVAKERQWEDVLAYDKDRQFNRGVYETFKNHAVTTYPLVAYRNRFSAYDARNQ